jgi:mono/diheme cytochrome c family protein
MRSLCAQRRLDVNLTRTFLVSAVLCGAFAAPAVHAQNAGGDKDAVAPLYRRYCQNCHGAEGRNGKQNKNGTDRPPDFTNASWHERRSDAQLITSILDGKGTGMPSFHDRLTRSQVKMLVAKVRGFAPVTSDKQKPRQASEDSSARQFEIEFKRLQQEFDRLRRQLEELKRNEEIPAEHSMPPPPGNRAAVRLQPQPAGIPVALPRTILAVFSWSTPNQIISWR